MDQPPKDSHPSCSALPPSPKPSDVAALVDQVDDFRRALWTMAAARPQGATARAASRARAALADVADPLHDLRRALEREAIVRAVPDD
jgi:hypothetical protein